MPEPASSSPSPLTERVAELLARAGAVVTDARLRDLAHQLGEPLTVVCMGEFNSGKSALINALLGTRATEEGVVPTTDRITLIRRGSPHAHGEVLRGRDLVEIRHPAPLLEGLCLVDTPGTNSVLEHHARITEEFLHRAELVLFVVSAERGFSKSERDFLAFVRGRWDRKLVCVLNKIDILDDRGATIVEGFVRAGFEQVLAAAPEIYPVSARLAQAARASEDRTGWEKSGVGALEARLFGLHAGDQRIALKLLGALKALESILREQARSLRDDHVAAHERVAELRDLSRRLDRHRASELETFLARWRACVDLLYVEELELQLASLVRLRFSGSDRAPTRAIALETQLDKFLTEASSAASAHEAELLEGIGERSLPPANSGATQPAVAAVAGAGAVPEQAESEQAESELAGARTRLGGWLLGSGLAASGLVTAGIAGVLHAPVVVLGAAGAGVVGLWRRDVERGRLSAALTAHRESARRRGEAALRAIFEELASSVRGWLDPALAEASGTEAELAAALTSLDGLAEACWALERDVEPLESSREGQLP